MSSSLSCFISSVHHSPVVTRKTNVPRLAKIFFTLWNLDKNSETTGLSKLVYGMRGPCGPWRVHECVGSRCLVGGSFFTSPLALLKGKPLTICKQIDFPFSLTAGFHLASDFALKTEAH